MLPPSTDSAASKTFMWDKGGFYAEYAVVKADQVSPIPGGYDIEPSPQQIEKLNRLVESGPFEVHVARTFPLDQVPGQTVEIDFVLQSPQSRCDRGRIGGRIWVGTK